MLFLFDFYSVYEKYSMAVTKIETEDEMCNIIAYLIDSNNIPSNMNRMEKIRFIRKANYFEYHEGRLFFKARDSILLRFFAEYQRQDKLEAIENRHRELACVRRDKLMFDLKTRIYCVRREEVEEVLERCTACMFRRRLTTRPPVRAIVASSIAERYQADLVDLRYYVEANDGYCWIVNILDVYSKYLMSVPLKSKSAADVKAGFEYLFLTFGEPKELQTDNGREFRNITLTQYLDHLNVRRIYGRARHPQTNGQVERCNKTLKALLGNLTGHNGGSNARWIDFHSKAVSTYNRTMHRAHGETPFRVFYNRAIGNQYVPLQSVESVDEEIDEPVVEVIDVDPFITASLTIASQNDEEIDYEVITIQEPSNDPEIDRRREIYLDQQLQQSSWKARTGPIYARGVKVVLYRDFDTNPSTRRRPFDIPTDGKVYEIVNIHENDFVDLREVNGNGIEHHYVDSTRIRIIKNQ